MTNPASLPSLDTGAPRRWLIAVALATAAVLALILPAQIFDTNFYSLWEATGLLAGDHPYRDFYEWGIPLQAVLSAIVQWMVGNRMIGEFIVIHWTFIIAGAVISFDLAYRLSRSIPAATVTAAVALAMLPDTPTFHYPKLFFYPAAIWLAWRYLDRPGLLTGAALGLVTSVAFLFRHDHGVYIGIGAVLACVLARWTAPARAWRRTFADTAAYAVAAALVLLPWLVTVQRNEGLTDYVRSRAELYQMWSGKGVFRWVLTRNPLQIFTEWSPAPQPGVVSFLWQPAVSNERRTQLEEQFGLHGVGGPDENQRWRYQVDNVNATRLSGLGQLINDGEGLNWEQIQGFGRWLPALEPARLWLAQVTLVVPIALAATAVLGLLRGWRRHTAPPTGTFHLLVAAAVLAAVDAGLLREVSYAHLVGPLTAAMSTRFLIVARPMTVPRWIGVTVAAVLVAISIPAALTCFQPTHLVTLDNLEVMRSSVDRMMISPPIDAYVSRAEAEGLMTRYDRAAWEKGEVQGWPELLLRYVHDCTASGDRVLISGQTPFQISYLIGRPIAGGQLFWHHRWRADPQREAQMVALLERQSVPFAYSTHDPVLDDLKFYPRIRRHFETYAVLPGSHGLLLVDTKRTPTGTFGAWGLPCFK